MTFCYRLALVVLILISVEFASLLSPKCGFTLLESAFARPHAQVARSYKPSKKSAHPLISQKSSRRGKKELSAAARKPNRLAKVARTRAPKVASVRTATRRSKERAFSSFVANSTPARRHSYMNFLASNKRNERRSYTNFLANNKRKKGHGYLAKNLLASNKRNNERRHYYMPKMASRGLNANTSLARKIASNAESTARCMTSQGLCYRGVKRAVAPLGIELHGVAAYSAKSQLMKDKRFRVVANRVKPAALKRGDILVHNKSAGKPYGHIAVYLGNGKEASDHIQKLVHGIGYGGTTVFRPVTQPNERGKDS